MRVLVVTPWYPTADHRWSGIFVREHTRAVAGPSGVSAVEASVLHLDGFRPGLSGRFQIEVEEDEALTAGIPTLRLRLPEPPIRRWFALALARGLRRAFAEVSNRVGRPDILHAHTFEAAFPAALLGRAEAIPLVVTEHHTGFQRRDLGLLARRKAKVGLERARYVLPVCRSLQDAIASHGIRGRFRVVPNAVDPAVFHPPDFEPEASRLLFVGGIHPRKGLAELFDALARVDDVAWSLHLVGQGPEESAYRARAERLGLAGRLTWHGALEKQAVADLMRQSQALVLPSRAENLPCVILEAQSVGLPTLATRVGGVAEVVSAREGILVEPRDVEGLVGGLQTLLTTEFDRAAIATGARRFSLRAVGGELLQIYREVLEAT